MKEVAVVAYCRTAIAKAQRGALSQRHPDDGARATQRGETCVAHRPVSLWLRRRVMSDGRRGWPYDTSFPPSAIVGCIETISVHGDSAGIDCYDHNPMGTF